MCELDGIARPDESHLPETIAPGSVLLVTGPVAPATNGLCLRVLHRYADPGDAGVVVTTDAGAEGTVGDYASVTGDGPAAPIGIVDTASRGQNITAFHRENPTIFTPGPADLARVAVAIDNLDAQLARSGVPHLVVRSVASFFEGGDPSIVARRIDRTFGDWTADGLVVLGVDFTAVDEPTVDALGSLADAVVTVAATESGGHRLEHRGTAARRTVDRTDAPDGDG